METLGLDLKDDSLKDTPKRSKMYVKEIFSGLNPKKQTQNQSVWKIKWGYSKMLVEKTSPYIQIRNIILYLSSAKRNVAYIPGKPSDWFVKINRIVQYFAKRPQVQKSA